MDKARVRHLTVAFSGAFAAFAALVILGFLGTIVYAEIAKPHWGSMAGMVVFFRCVQIGTVAAVVAFFVLLTIRRQW